MHHERGSPGPCRQGGMAVPRSLWLLVLAMNSRDQFVASGSSLDLAYGNAKAVQDFQASMHGACDVLEKCFASEFFNVFCNAVE